MSNYEDFVNKTYYDSALICLNGHIVNDSTNECKEKNSNYCTLCGEDTISVCDKCKAIIRGTLFTNERPFESIETAPNFCFQCGNPFPWLVKKIETALEIVIQSPGNENINREELKNDLLELTKDTPSTSLAALKINKVKKNIAENTLKIFNNLLVEIVSETAKKIILGK